MAGAGRGPGALRTLLCLLLAFFFLAHAGPRSSYNAVAAAAVSDGAAAAPVWPSATASAAAAAGEEGVAGTNGGDFDPSERQCDVCRLVSETIYRRAHDFVRSHETVMPVGTTQTIKARPRCRRQGGGRPAPFLDGAAEIAPGAPLSVSLSPLFSYLPLPLLPPSCRWTWTAW